MLRPEEATQGEETEAKGTKRKRDSLGEVSFRELQSLLRITRSLPTIQLFDAIWHVGFEWLQSVKKPAAEYLQKHYMVQVTSANLHKQMHCTAGTWGRSHLWFAGNWSGIIGIYPGSASGTQTLESKHAQWQQELGKYTRVAPQKVFDAMQTIFTDSWSKKYEWSSKREFPTWPQEETGSLLNGQTLRTAGRSPAIDFWNGRDRKLTGHRNYHVVHRRTDESSTNPATGTTTFWVMRAETVNKVRPADAEIEPKMAESLVRMIATEGKGLEGALQDCQVVTKTDDKLSLDQEKLAYFFNKHAVVMKGHLPNATWPRQRRRLCVPVDALLCTCVPFQLHAECEHVLFVKGLANDPIVAKFKNTPINRPRGRKRKADLIGVAESQPVKKSEFKPGGKKPNGRRG